MSDAAARHPPRLEQSARIPRERFEEEADVAEQPRQTLHAALPHSIERPRRVRGTFRITDIV
ncbi:MAG: hypothetical protein ACTINN_15100, partial [Brachybacterium tyrofermentans]